MNVALIKVGAVLQLARSHSWPISPPRCTSTRQHPA